MLPAERKSRGHHPSYENVSTDRNQQPITFGCPARLNPLAVARTDALPFQFAESSWEAELEKLWKLKFRAAIIGPKGSGKTTLLEQLYSRLAGSERPVVLRRTPISKTDQASLLSDTERLASDSILLLDSAEQLSRGNQRILLKVVQARNIGLVVTTHHPGILPTWIECRTNLELLHSLLGQLLPAQSTPWQLPANAAFRKYQGNIREVFRELYDLYASGELV